MPQTGQPGPVVQPGPAGRRTAVYRGADAHPKETYIYHAPTAGSGPLGAAAGGGAGPILRDRNRSLTDPRLWATEEADAKRYERLYYAANARGQVVALVDHNGELVEQYRWSATCVPVLVPLGDVNADGVVDADDAKLIKDLSGSPSYQVRGDLNLDGVIDSADEALVTANLGRAGGRASTASIRLRDGLYDDDVFPGAWSVGRVSDQCDGQHAGADIKPRMNPDNCIRDEDWRDPRVQRALREVAATCGCIPRFVCGAPGNFVVPTPGCPTVYLHNTNPIILAHELIHVIQICRSKNPLYPLNPLLQCEDLICMELQAYFHSGGCTEPLGIDLRNKCCERACASVRAFTGEAWGLPRGICDLLRDCEKKCRCFWNKGWCGDDGRFKGPLTWPFDLIGGCANDNPGRWTPPSPYQKEQQ